MTLVNLKFNIQDYDIDKKIFRYDDSLTFESMLTQFLIDTNSKRDLSIDHISFLCQSKVLNAPDNLPKLISSFFKTKNKTYIIAVKWTNDIIGGNIKKNLFQF